METALIVLMMNSGGLTVLTDSSVGIGNGRQFFSDSLFQSLLLVGEESSLVCPMMRISHHLINHLVSSYNDMGCNVINMLMIPSYTSLALSGR